jgi:cyclopropane-fatty-acyl-phospholipid synthase
MTGAGAEGLGTVVSTVESNYHYTQDPRIFELFLDPTLKYSSGLYLAEDDSLAQAQQQKLAFIAHQLELTPESTVLDVGCGWGSLVCHLARCVGCRVVGITPAPAQASYLWRRIEELGVADRVRVLLSSFEEADLAPRSFDAISFVGSIVHMKDKASALAKSYAACRPRATVYLSETCLRNRALQETFDERPGTKFIRDEVFGEGELIPLSSYIEFFEDAGFSMTRIRDLTPDYRHTIEHWRDRARSNRVELESIEPGIAARLERYFDVANAGWGYTAKQYAIIATKRR